MKTKIIIPLITIALLLAACGRNEQPAGKTASRSKAATAALLKQADINPDDVLYGNRRGEKITIRWDADFSDCKGIRILRNSEPTPANRKTVMNLPANSAEYVDTVPNARVFWYWIAVDIDGKKTRHIGPLRINADSSKMGKYTSASKDIMFVAQRTESSVVVAWDLPKGKYKEVVIRRRDKPDLPYGNNQRKKMIVHSTSERSGDMVDQLPDPLVDYWYWIDATKEDGSVVSKGPTKAKFDDPNKPKEVKPKEVKPKESQPKKSKPKAKPKKGKTKGKPKSKPKK